MRNQNVTTDDYVDWQLLHDAVLVPKDDCADCSLKYHESTQVERMFIATNDLNISEWSFWGLEWQLLEEHLADQIAH